MSLLPPLQGLISTPRTVVGDLAAPWHVIKEHTRRAGKCEAGVLHPSDVRNTVHTTAAPYISLFLGEAGIVQASARVPDIPPMEVTVLRCLSPPVFDDG